MRNVIAIAVCVLGIWSSREAARAQGPVAVDFNRDIRPLLSNRCLKCHGPDASARQAELRLDNREGATRDLGERRAVDPANPAASLLLHRVASEKFDERMPPPDSGPALTPREISLLRQWIEGGATYDPHWAFRPVTRARPTIALTQKTQPLSMPGDAWPQNGIDAFVLERLSAETIQPSPPARREIRLRRLFLDLLGLPPDLDQQIAFVADQSPDVFDRVIDQTLASPAYGERWGRHWLDQARYADTNGYTVDADRSIWPYRDWVIEALNRDLPFDQFTIEQLAGDLLPNATAAQKVATGFHRNTLINQEGGSDPEQFRNEAVVDRVNTTGAVWLGLTVGCAQCHAHKYDPISQQDYYRLFAFFNSNQDVNSVAPTMRVGSESQRLRLVELDKQLQAAKHAIEDYDRAQKEKTPAGDRKLEPVIWTAVEVTSVASEGGATLEKLDDRSILASGKIALSDDYTVRFPLPIARPTAVRIEVLVHPSLPQNGPGRASNGNFVLSELTLQMGERASKFVHAKADHSQPNYDVSKAIDGDLGSGWAINLPGGKLNVDRTAVFALEEIDGAVGEQAVLTLRFGPTPAGYSLGRFRISVTNASHLDLELPDPQRAALVASQQKIEEGRKQLLASMPETMIMGDLPQPRVTHVLTRGDFLRKGEPVEPGTLTALPVRENAPSANRLDLAQWLVDRRNPLTPRVAVNRIWARYFGVGLVETENDFGLQGTPPSHPALLDWLAAEFVDGQWSQKRVHRRIVQSATWQQSSEHRPDLATIDPLNRLLARQVRLRVDAEIVRDLGLAASGLLVSRLGGPSVYPPQPEGVYAFTQRAAVWNASKGGDRYRRGLYTFFMRSVPYPMLTTFDTPKFNTTCTVRLRSNTPLQSLTLANDDTMLEFARILGDRLMRHPGNDLERLRYAYRLGLAREPDAWELQRFHEYLEAQRQHLDAVAAGEIVSPPPAGAAPVTNSATDPAAVIERAMWVLAARVLLNLDEFITRD